MSMEILTQNKNEDRWACWLRLTDGTTTWDLPAGAPGNLTAADLPAYFQDDADRLWRIAQAKQHPVARRELDGDTDSPTWYVVRRKRNDLLYDCDWTQGNDSPLTGQAKQAWKDYRQLLRDIPQTCANPEDVIWPTKPG